MWAEQNVVTLQVFILKIVLTKRSVQVHTHTPPHYIQCARLTVSSGSSSSLSSSILSRSFLENSWTRTLREALWKAQTQQTMKAEENYHLTLYFILNITHISIFLLISLFSLTVRGRESRCSDPCQRYSLEIPLLDAAAADPLQMRHRAVTYSSCYNVNQSLCVCFPESVSSFINVSLYITVPDIVCFATHWLSFTFPLRERRDMYELMVVIKSCTGYMLLSQHFLLSYLDS